jgi:hypothetical protein
VPPPEAHPFECDEGPDAIREWLKERHKWHPGSAELIAMFSALDEARTKTTNASAVVRLSDAMCGCLRDLGAFDDVYVPPSYEDGKPDPARLLGGSPDPLAYLR